jgi:hypothetical protein
MSDHREDKDGQEQYWRNGLAQTLIANDLATETPNLNIVNLNMMNSQYPLSDFNPASPLPLFLNTPSGFPPRNTHIQSEVLGWQSLHLSHPLLMPMPNRSNDALNVAILQRQLQHEQYLQQQLLHQQLLPNLQNRGLLIGEYQRSPVLLQNLARAGGMALPIQMNPSLVCSSLSAVNSALHGTLFRQQTLLPSSSTPSSDPSQPINLDLVQVILIQGLFASDATMHFYVA